MMPATRDAFRAAETRVEDVRTRGAGAGGDT